MDSPDYLNLFFLIDMKKNVRRILFASSVVIAILLVFISLAGIYGNPYENETLLWRIQCEGQDLIDLIFVFPVLVVSSILLLRNSPVGRLMWPGVIFYLIYTFTIYCFDVHFNAFFLEYCAVLGLCIYSFIYFLYREINEHWNASFSPNILIKSVAFYSVFIAAVFYLLWLSDILIAINSAELPSKLDQMKLPTNPIHVLDVAILLPFMILTGILLLRGKTAALYLASYILTFTILMNVTILVLDILEEDNAVMRITFIVLTLLSIILLAAQILFIKRNIKR